VDFPTPFVPDMSTRAGRMMSAGRCKVTVTRKETEEHITVFFNCFADNRNKEFDSENSKRWVNCQLADATHVFVEVPTPSGQYNDKIGTFYPRGNKWYEADNADPHRVRAAILSAMWLMDQSNPFTLGFTFQEAMECGRCGAELTDPTSITRGIGPDCYGALTGSQHQVKWTGQDPPAPVVKFPEKSTPDKAPTPVSEDTKWAYEELGLVSAAENATYHLLKGMSEDQLLTCKEWIEDRLREIAQLRHSLVQEAREAEPVQENDQSFMGR
jgi:Family of unknown function (DUF6011)